MVKSCTTNVDTYNSFFFFFFFFFFFSLFFFEYHISNLHKRACSQEFDQFVHVRIKLKEQSFTFFHISQIYLTRCKSFHHFARKYIALVSILSYTQYYSHIYKYFVIFIFSFDLSLIIISIIFFDFCSSKKKRKKKSKHKRHRARYKY